MLDLTQSLRVAASFALHRSKTGFVYVFGMPHTHGSISHYIDNELVLVKLQNVCPPDAVRPHYQEGYLVCKLPVNREKEVKDNFAKLLIGKYYIDNSQGHFWGNGFHKISRKALLPTKDKYLTKLKKILDKDPRIEIAP